MVSSGYKHVCAQRDRGGALRASVSEAPAARGRDVIGLASYSTSTRVIPWYFFGKV